MRYSEFQRWLLAQGVQILMASSVSFLLSRHLATPLSRFLTPRQKILDWNQKINFG